MIGDCSVGQWNLHVPKEALIRKCKKYKKFNQIVIDDFMKDIENSDLEIGLEKDVSAHCGTIWKHT